MVAEQLILEVRTRYGIGENYARRYLEYWQRSRGKSFTSMEEILASPDPEPMWFDYALSTNWRGDQLFQQLRPRLGDNAHRYLDVGCGFGGCLVAFARQGFDVTGIEVDPERAALADANCLDFGVSSAVLTVSILDDSQLARLGKFDVVTCSDVIEHVLDVPKALSNMVALLNHGGILFMEIPNGRSINFVAADGHFGLFCATLLERRDAMVYHRHFFQSEYDVGYYHPISYYDRALASLGCKCSILYPDTHPPVDLARCGDFVERAMLAHIDFTTKTAPRLPPYLSMKVQAHFALYVSELVRGLTRLHSGGSEIASFEREYLADFWVLVAERVGSGK